MKRVLQRVLLVITFLATLYVSSALVVGIHANSKFNVCVQKWKDARDRNDLPAMESYYRCEELAHEDTLTIGKTPAEWKRRWNADYEREAAER